MASSPIVKAEGDRSAEFADAHARLLADDTIQFKMEPYRNDAPDWLRSIIEFIGGNMPVFRFLFWVMVVILAGILLYHLAKSFGLVDWGRKADPEAGEMSYRPDEAPARALLVEADSLAERGLFDQAAHLLLFRSIEEIDARRPRIVRASLTSRDIATSQAVPDVPRRAFALIVEHVERSLFGGRSLQEQDWHDCRAAYERFAFQEGWR